MTFDMNDVAPQQSGDLIPDGTFAKLVMTLRKGGADGMSEADRGLLKVSNQPGSDVLTLDAEFTVAEGPHARRKFWQNFTVQGGKLDEQGQSIGWKISKGQFRAMIDSALGLNPEDMSEAAKAKRVLRGLADLDGISFVAKIQIEFEPEPRLQGRQQARPCRASHRARMAKGDGGRAGARAAVEQAPVRRRTRAVRDPGLGPAAGGL